MLSSSRRAIVYPHTNRTDTADVPRDIAALVAALEVDVIYGQGTLAVRPTSTAGTPGIAGRVYMATDQTPHAFYYDYGTGWDPVGALAAGSVGTTQLADGSVTTVKIADGAVNSAKITNGSIGGVQLADANVSAAKIADALKPSAGAAGGTEALRALGTAAGTAAAGTHASQHTRTGADPLSMATWHDYGTLASRPTPTAAATGMHYTATDVNGNTTYMWGGSSWFPIAGSVNTGRGTSLPGSPTDGQEFILVDSLTAATYAWRLQYVSGSTNTDKWEFIGGSALKVLVAAPGAGGTGAYANFATDVTLTPPRAGVYDVALGADMNLQRSGDSFYISPNGASIAASDAQALQFVDGGSDNSSSSVVYNNTLSLFKRLPNKALTAAALHLQGKFTNNGAVNGAYAVSNAYLAIRPVRLS